MRGFGRNLARTNSKIPGVGLLSLGPLGFHLLTGSAPTRILESIMAVLDSTILPEETDGEPRSRLECKTDLVEVITMACFPRHQLLAATRVVARPDGNAPFRGRPELNRRRNDLAAS